MIGDMRDARRRLTRRRVLGGAIATAGAAAGSVLLGAPAARAAGTAAAPAGQLRVSLPAEIVSLDPMGASAAEESVRVVAAHIYDTLVVHDVRTRGFLPSLAAKWQTPDPNTWVFTLRAGVKFHDGSPLTARDVKASLDRMIAQPGPLAPLWTAVAGTDAPSDTTVRIRTKTPLGTMPANLSLTSILPADKMNTPGFFNQPIGSGPFRIGSYKPQGDLVLAANTAYWGPQAGVKTLTFRDIPEVASRVTALITGEIDLTYALPPDQLPTLARNASLRIQSTPSYRYYFVWMNIKHDPFTDARVRQAMILAIDQKTILNTLLKGAAQQMTAPIPSTVFGYAPQRPYPYDPAKAKQLLAAAGHPNGFDATMIWNPDSGPQDREIAQALFSYWNAVGARIKDGQAERAQWLDKLLKLDWDMDFQTNIVVTGDADFVLRRLYSTSANRMGYSNPVVDHVVDLAAQSSDQERRKVYYGQACEIIWDDAIGVYPFELTATYVSRKVVQGFIPTPSSPVFTAVTVQS
jgi:peptide/nickel transport system substrate-binding protein